MALKPDSLRGMVYTTCLSSNFNTGLDAGIAHCFNYVSTAERRAAILAELQATHEKMSSWEKAVEEGAG